MKYLSLSLSSWWVYCPRAMGLYVLIWMRELSLFMVDKIY